MIMPEIKLDKFFFLFIFLYIFYTQSFKMIGSIRKTFIDMLGQSTWMDETSKSKAIEKVRPIRRKS